MLTLQKFDLKLTERAIRTPSWNLDSNIKWEKYMDVALANLLVKSYTSWDSRNDFFLCKDCTVNGANASAGDISNCLYCVVFILLLEAVCT